MAIEKRGGAAHRLGSRDGLKRSTRQHPAGVCSFARLACAARAALWATAPPSSAVCYRESRVERAQARRRLFSEVVILNVLRRDGAVEVVILNVPRGDGAVEVVILQPIGAWKPSDTSRKRVEAARKLRGGASEVLRK